MIRVIYKVRLLSFDDFYTPRPLFPFYNACSLSLGPRTPPTIVRGSIKEKPSCLIRKDPVLKLLSIRKFKSGKI